MTLYKWSQTASADATADSTINWAEGQSPSSVNDSARAMMAATAKYRDDIAGAIVTGGTATAYTVTSYQVFNSLANMDGKVIAFTPHATNTAGFPNVTLNVDGLGAKSLQVNPNVELPAGFLVSGSPYVALYNASNGVFYLQNSFGNPYTIPIGGSLDFWGSTAPNSSFALMYGQAVSRTTYSALFSLMSTTYGTGDGSTTFNIPDVRGRVVAGKDDMGGSAASRLSGTSITTGGATTLGGTGGTETKTLITANLPAYTPSGSVSVSGGTASLARSGISYAPGASAVFVAQSPSDPNNLGAYGATLSGTTGTFTGTAQGGASTAFALTQPTIIANKLLRLI
ncbi:tail fiber protein [Bradyrhizobium canariense]|uniref:tail fiber protein n=1 Tax=Bradyrhizobium canariense TaxID=255045 RepID=UPI001B89DA4D|nr:tail fiber protein [Bradyrhizobium canariense]MBR0953332.1 tail fiber protein [Bradyrhizobium canariense]